MNWEIGSRVALSVVLASSLSAGESDSSITVLAYNNAAIASEVLAQTESEAARIHQRAGIGILWLNCPLTPKEDDQFAACQIPPGPTTLLLRILSQSSERLRPEPGSFGFAMFPGDGSFAAVANVFPHDAEQLAQRRGMRPAVILGHVVAHEIGHLLLGVGSHGVRGIMHVPWGLRELEIIAQGQMVFIPAEAAAMRLNVRARIHAGEKLERIKQDVMSFLPEQAERIRDQVLAVRPYAQSTEAGLKIDIHLYNYSGVSAEELARAEQETVRIYRRIGVEMGWRNCPRSAEELAQNTACELPAVPTKFIVRLLSDEMADRFALGDDVYGFAPLPVTSEFGVLANVFADRALETWADGGLGNVVLGHLMAHELGHLLLGEAGHAASGIMHVPWQTKELERIKQGGMYFLPEQAERIRTQVLARMRATPSHTSVDTPYSVSTGPTSSREPATTPCGSL